MQPDNQDGHSSVNPLVPDGKSKLKHFLLGNPAVVRQAIHQLHALGYAPAGSWSKPQIAGALGQPGEVISVLIKQGVSDS